MIELAQVMSHMDWDGGIDDKEVAIAAVAVIKVLDQEGRPYLAFRAIKDLPLWEVLGMLRYMLLDVEAQCVNETSPYEEDDDGGS